MKESIRQLERVKCTGCNSCAAVCPNQAIQMRKISEGFFYPFVDGFLCTWCGKCSEHCPEIAGLKESTEEKTEVFAYAASDIVRWDCADGGAMESVIQLVLEQNGKVCVPLFSKDFRSASYEIIEKAEELKMRTITLQVECSAKSILPMIKKALEEYGLLFFIGTPCQIAGVRRYFGVETENLLLGEYLCHGVTSQDVWSEYLENISSDATVEDVKFGAKQIGCRSSICIKYGRENSREIYKGGLEEDPFLQAYGRGLSLRSCCLDCSYSEPQGDFVFGNLRDIGKYRKDLDDKKGLSSLVFRTQKAKYYIEELRKKAKIFERLPEDVVLDEPVKRCSAEERKRFFNYWESYGWKNLLEHMDGIYKKSPPPLQTLLDYRARDGRRWIIPALSIWQEMCYDGRTILLPDGHTSNQWVMLPLMQGMKQGASYEFHMWFKAMTAKRNVRIMAANKKAGEKGIIWDVIWEQNIANNTWTEASGRWIPKNADMNYLFFSSTDFQGVGSYICIDWIYIREAEANGR